MKINFSERALRDLDSIGAYLHERNPVASSMVIGAITVTIMSLRDFPELDRLLQPKSIRRIVEPRYGYLIYYRIMKNSSISIVSIMHPARRRLLPG